MPWLAREDGSSMLAAARGTSSSGWPRAATRASASTSARTRSRSRAGDWWSSAPPAGCERRSAAPTTRQDGPFDLITLTDVLEHLEEPRRCLAALAERLSPSGLLVVSTPNRRSLPGARRWLAEKGVPGIRLRLAPVDNWQTWIDLESHGAAAGLVAVSRRGIFFRPGGWIGSQIGRAYGFGPVRRAERALSRTPVGRFGFYICLGFRPA